MTPYVALEIQYYFAKFWLYVFFYPLGGIIKVSQRGEVNSHLASVRVDKHPVQWTPNDSLPKVRFGVFIPLNELVVFHWQLKAIKPLRDKLPDGEVRGNTEGQCSGLSQFSRKPVCSNPLILCQRYQHYSLLLHYTIGLFIFFTPKARRNICKHKVQAFVWVA